MRSRQFLSVSALAGISCASYNSTNTTSYDLSVGSTGGNATSGYQYGLMFEDISHSGDGGIYAELIQNRAFQGSTVFPSTIEPWTAVGNTELTLKNLSDPLSSALPTSLNVAGTGSTGTVGISNPGYWGIDVKAQTYNGSFWVKGSYDGEFTASLQSYITNETFATTKIQSKSTADNWTEHTYTLVPTKAAANTNNTFSLTFDVSGTDGSLDFNLISLFPPTYNDRPNGLRPDLVSALKALKPSFFRIPGGNNLEGNDPPYHWKWNETIGPLKDRPGYPGTWDYENTNGLGLVEYMLWCQDLDVEPMFAVWAGFYLDGTALSEDELQPYVQDVLNELEFVRGDTSTTYGALRASLGYPSPWSVKFVEVGNEDNLNGGGDSYASYRFDAFKSAINEKYPDIEVFASTSAYNNIFGTGEGEGYQDYHQYTRPDYFVSQFNYFDNFTTGFRTMVGEYATVQPNLPGNPNTNWSDAKIQFPNWIGTVAEAVFLLGTERNADKMFGAAYAPLLQNLNSYQWTPDLISFTADQDADILSTSYHLVQLFSTNRLTETLPTSNATFGPLYWVAGYSNASDSYLFKAAVYNATADVPVSVAFEGARNASSAVLTVMTAPGPFSWNDQPGTNVVESTTTTLTAGEGGKVEFSLPNYSVAVLEVKK